MTKLLSFLEYLKARAEEKSTWASIGIGTAGAAALEKPWSYLFIALAVIGALVPTGSS